MIESITSEGCILAYVIPATTHEQTNFLTPPDLELQVGFVVHDAGSVIAPHQHNPAPRNINRHCEVLLVKKGRCEVDFFDEDQQFVTTRELGTDDIVVLARGGHGFRMIEDTILLEVKQGPYLGLEEKELLS